MKSFLSIVICLMFWLLLTSSVGWSEDKNPMNKAGNSIDSYNQYVLDIYNKCNLKDKLDFAIFNQAMWGYNSLSLYNKKVISIIDFSKPSTERRLFIIDIENQKVIYHTYVSHGKNSGVNIPTKFSNRIGSNQSSLGFYRTAETYIGKHGYSLMLDGMEEGLNDNARKRAIVIHGAKYVSEEFIQNYKRLGRSWGCPAVSDELSKEIIDLIKDGSCLYIYSDEETYKRQSTFVEANLN